MAWTIVRHGDPTAGEHALGGVLVTFDDTGTAVIDDDGAAEMAMAFPGYFTVTEGGELPPPPATPVPAETEITDLGDGPPEVTGEADAGNLPATGAGPYDEATLEEMTVADLREVAALLDMTVGSRATKAELIAAILAAQQPPLIQE